MTVTDPGLFEATSRADLLLEPALEAQQKRLEELRKQANGCLVAVKHWLKACESGDVVGMERASRAASDAEAPLSSAIASVAAGWTFDVERYLSEGHWLAEVKAIAAERHSIRVRIDGGELICAPISLVARSPYRRLSVGRKPWPNIRPTVIARELEKARARLKDAKSQEFLESLYAAWKARPNPDLPVLKFTQAYSVFCLAPGWKRENSPASYAEAVLALAKSGLPATRDGTRFQFEFPSEKTKEREVLAVRDEDGREIRYVGVRFI
jgi:hypothetical protein